MTTLTREQHALRGALIQESYQRNPGRGYLAAIQEGAQRFREGKRPGQPAAPAILPGVIAEAVAAALVQQSAARKARKAAARKALERTAAASAAARVLRERQQLAAQFSDAAIGTSLREASGADLAVIATTALSGAGQPGPAPRPVAEVAVDPRALSLEDMGVAAAAGMAGSSPFWAGGSSGGGLPRGQSPFWRGQQGRGASRGSSDA